MQLIYIVDPWDHGDYAYLQSTFFSGRAHQRNSGLLNVCWWEEHEIWRKFEKVCKEQFGGNHTVISEFFPNVPWSKRLYSFYLGAQCVPNWGLSLWWRWHCPSLQHRSIISISQSTVNSKQLKANWQRMQRNHEIASQIFPVKVMRKHIDGIRLEGKTSSIISGPKTRWNWEGHMQKLLEISRW